MIFSPVLLGAAFFFRAYNTVAVEGLENPAAAGGSGEPRDAAAGAVAARGTGRAGTLLSGCSSLGEPVLLKLQGMLLPGTKCIPHHPKCGLRIGGHDVCCDKYINNYSM